MPDSVASVGSGGTYTYDENGVGACEPTTGEPLASDAFETNQPQELGTNALVLSHDNGAEDAECFLKAAKAGTVCAGAAAVIVSGAPTLIGGVVAAFIGGAACGLEVVDAYVCYEGE